MTQIERLRGLSLDAAAQRLTYASQGTQSTRSTGSTYTFEELLQKAAEKREIALSGDDMLRLKDGVGKARQKGIQKTLILMDQRAFIVSVPDNTVVTAMVGCELKENVFTQIDGTVII